MVSWDWDPPVYKWREMLDGSVVDGVVIGDVVAGVVIGDVVDGMVLVM